MLSVCRSLPPEGSRPVLWLASCQPYRPPLPARADVAPRLLVEQDAPFGETLMRPLHDHGWRADQILTTRLFQEDWCLTAVPSQRCREMCRSQSGSDNWRTGMNRGARGFRRGAC